MWFQEFYSSFTQIDLVFSKQCYAFIWISEQNQQPAPLCFSKEETLNFLRTLPDWRQFFEELRRCAVSFFESGDGDRFGVIRHLFFNAASTKSDSYQWLMRIGFVHLSNLTGFYWIYFQDFIQRIPLRRKWLHFILFYSIYFIFFACSGFKRIYLRSLFLIFIKTIAKKNQIRIHIIAYLMVFIGLDFLFFGSEKGIGVLHYALAILGGLFYENTENYKRESKWIGHFKLSIGSYLTCIGFELSQGYLSLLTPLFSIITVSLFGGIVFPMVILFLGLKWINPEASLSLMKLFFQGIDIFLSELAYVSSVWLKGHRCITPSLAGLSLLFGIFLWLFCQKRHRL